MRHSPGGTLRRHPLAGSKARERRHGGRASTSSAKGDGPSAPSARSAARTSPVPVLGLISSAPFPLPMAARLPSVAGPALIAQHGTFQASSGREGRRGSPAALDRLADKPALKGNSFSQQFPRARRRRRSRSRHFRRCRNREPNWPRWIRQMPCGWCPLRHRPGWLRPSRHG